MLLVAFDYLLQVDGFFGDKIVSAVFAIAYQTMSAVAFVARVGMYRESYFFARFPFYDFFKGFAGSMTLCYCIIPGKSEVALDKIVRAVF